MANDIAIAALRKIVADMDYQSYAYKIAKEALGKIDGKGNTEVNLSAESITVQAPDGGMK